MWKINWCQHVGVNPGVSMRVCFMHKFVVTCRRAAVQFRLCAAQCHITSVQLKAATNWVANSNLYNSSIYESKMQLWTLAPNTKAIARWRSSYYDMLTSGWSFMNVNKFGWHSQDIQSTPCCHAAFTLVAKHICMLHRPHTRCWAASRQGQCCKADSPRQGRSTCVHDATVCKSVQQQKTLAATCGTQQCCLEILMPM